MRKLTPLIWALCAAGMSSAAWAGLSHLRVLSQPGQPFEAELAIKDEALPDSLHVELADRNRYPVLEPYSASATKLHFTLQRQGDNAYLVKVSGPAHFEEAFLSFAVEVSWPSGRLVREYHVEPPLEGGGPQAPRSAEDKTKKVLANPHPNLGLKDISLGALKLHSVLGEPLRAEVEVLGSGLHRGELNAEPDLGVLGRVSATWLERTPERALLLLSSHDPVNSPVVNVMLRVRHGEQETSKIYMVSLESGATMLRPEQTPTAPAVAGAERNELQRAVKYRVRRGDTLEAIAVQLASKGRPIKAVMNWLVEHNQAAFIGGSPDRLRAEVTLRYPAKWGRIAAAGLQRVQVATPDKPAAHGEVPRSAKPLTVVKTAPSPQTADSHAARSARLAAHLHQQDQELVRLDEEASKLENQLKGMRAGSKQGKPAKPAKPIQSDPTQGKIKQAESLAPDHAAPAVEPIITTEPKKVILPASHAAATAAEGGLLDSANANSPMVRGAALAVLGASLGAMVLLNRRKRGAAARQNGALSATTGMTAMAGAAAGSGNGLISMMTNLMAGKDGVELEQDVDWLAEADVFMSYDRNDLALDTLKSGIAQVPSRQDLHYKLLQVYAKLDDTANFTRHAQEVLDYFGADSVIGRRVKELGASVLPDDPLFNEMGESGGGAGTHKPAGA